MLLREVYRRLDDRPLQPDDNLYVPIYDRPDGEDPVAKMQTRIEWAEVESLQLFSGFRGSGKTTELFRLRKSLEAKGNLVLYGDALDYLNPADEIDITMLLLAVAGSFSDALAHKSGIKTLGESFWQRVGNYLTRTSLQVTEATAKIEGKTPAGEIFGELKAGLDLKVALKTAPSFRQKLQGFLANRLGELKAEVNAFVEEGVRTVRQSTNNPNLQIVFLFDQFEQLRGSRGNEEAVIQSVERVFANHLDLLRLPYVHVIYTVPPWLQFVLPGTLAIETLPSVRLWCNDTDRTVYEAGWTIFRNVVTKRFGPDGFPRVFGCKDPLADRHTLADKLIAVSGGHLRDLLRLFREMLVLIQTWRTSLPVTEEVIERAIVNVRNEYLPIAVEDSRWLAEIEKQRVTALPSSSSEHVSRLSRFLDSHLVLYLTNGKDWYDIHPLIRETVAELSAKKP